MERLKERLSSARRALETLKELSGIEKVTVIQIIERGSINLTAQK